MSCNLFSKYSAHWLACRAFSNQAPVSNKPSQGAEINRIFDASCPACLQRYAKSSAKALLKKIIASPNAMPFLVPQKHNTSTPLFQLTSAAV